MTDKPCAFCEALQRNKNIRAFYNDLRKEEGEEKIYEDYTVALVVRSYAKGKKRTAGRTTDYRNQGIGYQLNFCPECGRKLTGESRHE